MENVHCSPVQYMAVKKADYGDFNIGGRFYIGTNIDTNCSILTNCQVKSFCGGKRSCELTIDNNLLPSQYCSDTSKEMYTEYNCEDSNSSTTITTAPNIRLSQSPNEGYIEIKHGSTWKSWRQVEEKHWGKIRQKMLCRHLGFKETDANDINFHGLILAIMIVTGDLICYNTHSGETSCCVHLKPYATKFFVSLPYARCKICDNPILQDLTAAWTVSGSGSQNYSRSLFNSLGWCASGSSPYLMLDLRKEYHVTRVVTMGNKDQTKWSESYSLKYSYDKTLVDDSRAVQISGNQNGYQASTTTLDIYNVRYIKIQSSRSHDFCLRIELCGK
ncbi:retinoschisin-like, partial, partial [Paramuricea clavata]